ncbi:MULTISPECIES: GTP pyrophosphokinase family protein [Halomonas]|uniref:GTP pyrophosphokinase n=1 Tax=Halomonas TaxID=2745 RepID=UPI001C95B3BF|nr:MULTISPECIES: RelA/SpoT domain-containing protein [Halomonas]MBY6209715.1 RelA/SpoT domain-containing protein [Halomonas sp. DP3Y7-2]MBY6229934.1 RelA/SpoT domain-containing protein [Halomonas sp. DP3Y7-1]MCA0918251.1 RelA/SpoT domain-containing protein [Halomonas denitrificans]
MNEPEFRERWDEEKPIYEAWGGYIVEKIKEKIKSSGEDLGTFFKVPPGYRLKDDSSLVDKAFYRPGKNYSNPYDDIEDKVGARFIVLLLDDIDKICDILDEEDAWVSDPCKHFADERDKDPLLFTYQSVHYILRPKEELEFSGITIPDSIPCEVQIRTLLQHAHAELTHDAIYKAKRTVQPEVHRTVAKSMALIETTDGFFSEVTRKLHRGPLESYSIIDRLDGIYQSVTGIKPHQQKSSIVIWDEFEQFIDDDLIDSISGFLKKHDYIPGIIVSRYNYHNIYQQSTVLFLFWMLKNKRARLLKDWPLSTDILDNLANDIGVSTFNE